VPRIDQHDSGDISQKGGSMVGGLLISSALHLVLLGVVVLGLPIFWEPEPLPEAIGIELAQLSDITAAPKVDKAGKPEKKPEPEKKVVPVKEQPKKNEAPKPNPPAPAAPPPPEPEPVAVPQPEKPAEEKKPEEKKPEPPKEEPKKEAQKKEEKKKETKAPDEELDSLLKNVLQEPPAPETPEKPKTKAEAAPQQESTGPQTASISEIPMTASEEDGIRAQIEKVWNLGSVLGSPNLAGLVIELRIEVQPDGTVSRVTLLNDKPGDPFYRAAADSARRAVLIASPLKLPVGKQWPTMRLRFYPDQVVQ
jgi:outer membrane biosynthesis protein TonB